MSLFAPVHSLKIRREAAAPAPRGDGNRQMRPLPADAAGGRRRCCRLPGPRPCRAAQWADGAVLRDAAGTRAHGASGSPPAQRLKFEPLLSRTLSLTRSCTAAAALHTSQVAWCVATMPHVSPPQSLRDLLVCCNRHLNSSISKFCLNFDIDKG